MWLERGQRNTGLLQEIMDKIRYGKQDENDLNKLMFNRRMFQSFVTDRGIHYSNESASVYNCQQLWNECKRYTPTKRVYVCRAAYYTTENNDYVVAALSSIQASKYQFAQDVLCLTVGCEVRLIKNINIEAGLVNNAIGTVVRVIYDNADVQALVNGQFPPPYCVIVDFPSFRGFLNRNAKSTTTERKYPFKNHTLVPLYKHKFYPDSVSVNVRKRQQSQHYRQQFPIDLSSNITAHRAQGQTFKNCTLSVKLSLESPENVIPADISSLIYVACSRVTKLEDLYVDPIFPSVWTKIGKSPFDEARREHEKKLKEYAGQFACENGFYNEFSNEISYKPDYSNNATEWKGIVSRQTPEQKLQLKSVEDYCNMFDDDDVPCSLKVALTERFIGIDQGIKNFAIVAVDRRQFELPKIVGAELYNLEELGLDEKRRFAVHDLVLLLQEKTVLFTWMQHNEQHLVLPKVDRVVVLIEQMSILHQLNKQFCTQFGRFLQSFFNLKSCIVKLSQPNNHGRTGPLFKLGTDIVSECNLVPISYSYADCVKAKRPQQTDDVYTLSDKRPRLDESKNDSGSVNPNVSEEVASVKTKSQLQNEQYRMKKSMSAAVFNYFITATQSQQLEMQVLIDDELQQLYRQRADIHKYDDLGDALLHALKPILCGGSNYRQLVPKSITTNSNRTVVLTILPTTVYWAVTKCSWNVFEIEEVGFVDITLENLTYSSEVALMRIRHTLSKIVAITEFSGKDSFCSSTNFIKVIVKQLKANGKEKLNRKAAGALTNSTVMAVTKLCDDALKDGTLYCNKNKTEGWTYSRTCKLSGNKYQVTRSTGKHTNAIICCLEWMRENVTDFVKNRTLRLNRSGQVKFFNALRTLAYSGKKDKSLEMVRLSEHFQHQLKQSTLSDISTATTLSDLILIALNNNQQYISAVAEHYRIIPSKYSPTNKKTMSSIRNINEEPAGNNQYSDVEPD
jgi:hypothetical protein